jgi:hypothetical protein
MAGSPERSEKGISERVREVMVRFEVDEKQARQLLGYSAIIAYENFAKWKSNLRIAQKRKAAEILELIMKAQNSDAQALEEAKAKLEAICTAASWEAQ